MFNRTVIAFAIAVIAGASLMAVGRMWITEAGELHDRTERVVAVVMDGNLEFTTFAGRSMVVALQDGCKRSQPSPRRGCIEAYVNGDELLVWYDSADPARTWEGSTPGGGMATFVLYLGIVLTITGSLYLWFILVHPPLVRLIERMKGNNEIPRTG